jgi:hypothetical protein
MAKKSTGRLAGLAALAAAAYMLNKGKGKGEDKAGAKEPTASKAEPKEDAVDTGDFLSRRLNRIDTDDGLAYSTNNLSPMSSPASVARAEKAPSASAAKAPATGGPTPSRDPGGAGKRGGVSVGTGSGGGRGAAVGEEAAYRASRDTGDAMSRRMKAENDGGKSVVDRQNAGAKKAGLSVDDYFTSGKAQIDKQDESGTAAKPTSVTTDETKLSLSDRIKLSRERARSGSGQTDTRSVNERFASLKKGGAVKKMASGGMTSSASKRADGIATKGKTRGRMC